MYEYLFTKKGDRVSSVLMEASSAEALGEEVGPEMTPVKIVSERVSIDPLATEPELSKKEDTVEESLELALKIERQGPETSVHSESSVHH
jgi:hypothetical protein